jgi:hypothetical protein
MGGLCYLIKRMKYERTKGERDEKALKSLMVFFFFFGRLLLYPYRSPVSVTHIVQIRDGEREGNSSMLCKIKAKEGKKGNSPNRTRERGKKPK